MKRSSRHGTAFSFIVAALLVAAGCAWHPYKELPPLDRPELQRALLTSLQQRYPAQFRLKQRLALRALGKQYDMIAYLIVEPGGNFRAIAMGEMGGRIFDLSTEKGEAKIYKKPDEMPRKPLLDGVIGDIRHLFTLPDFTRTTLKTDPRGRVFLSLGREKGTISDYDFTGEGLASGHKPELRHSLESDGRCIIREADYLEYDLPLDDSHRIPRRILIRNYRWHYALEIQMLQIAAGAGGASGTADEPRGRPEQ